MVLSVHLIIKAQQLKEKLIIRKMTNQRWDEKRQGLHGIPVESREEARLELRRPLQERLTSGTIQPQPLCLYSWQLDCTETRALVYALGMDLKRSLQNKQEK